MKTFKDFINEQCNCWKGYKRKAGTAPCSKGSCVKEEAEQIDEGDWSKEADELEGKKKPFSDFADKVENEKHKVNVTVSNPNHPAATERNEKQQKFIRVKTNDKQKALKLAKDHFKKKGYKVHDVTHAGVVNEEVELDEAIKLNSKVQIHAPGKSYHGKVGQIGEIRHGAYSGAPKTYTVDYDDGKSIQLDKNNIKLNKEEVELDEGFAYHMKKAIEADKRGDTKMKDYHLGNAKTARLAIPSEDLPKHKELLAKYKTMKEEVEIDEHIVKVSGGYQLQSKSTGKNLGTYPTRAGAEKREKQVQYFKHMKEDADSNDDLTEAAVDSKGYKSSTGGLTQKGRDAYNRAHGSHLKAPVTKKPSTLKKGSKAYNRRKSFCARMSGVEGPMRKPNGEPTRKALALRKWNC